MRHNAFASGEPAITSDQVHKKTGIGATEMEDIIIMECHRRPRWASNIRLYISVIVGVLYNVI